MPRQAKGKRGQSPPAATTNFANQKAASQAATNSLNSLRRVDPSIVEILASATHATLYNFGADQEWERADVEGPLFIAARNAHPRVRLVVLNRLSMTNMVEDVDETFELDHAMALLGGGTNADTSLQALCKICHAMKSALEQSSK